MIKRILGFNKHNWRHISTLSKNMMKQLFIELNWHEAKEAWYWITLHLTMDSNRVDE